MNILLEGGRPRPLLRSKAAGEDARTPINSRDLELSPARSAARAAPAAMTIIRPAHWQSKSAPPRRWRVDRSGDERRLPHTTPPPQVRSDTAAPLLSDRSSAENASAARMPRSWGTRQAAPH